MNKMIILVLLIGIIFFPKLTHAIYFATDTVYLYQDNKRVDENLLFVSAYGTYSELCLKGICQIGQQAYPVRIYIPKEEGLLPYRDFIAMSPYTGGHYDGNAKNVWNKENEQKYAQYLQDNSKISLLLNPGPSEGGDPCDTPQCFGGRVGDDRTFNFDIATGAVSEVNNVQALVQSYKSQLLLFSGIVSCLLIVVVIKKKQK